ncbi:MAG: hypothetical protein KatS3mg060_1143 [Dehalococcoidia bacterium]|nr:MAG: hypothetical protein KatS3mg060_1143 [Dehalococcoidia bacterium]
MEYVTPSQLRAAYNISAFLGHYWAECLGPETLEDILERAETDQARARAVHAAVELRTALGYGPDGPCGYYTPTDHAVTTTGRCRWWVSRDGSVSVTVRRPAGEAFTVHANLAADGRVDLVAWPGGSVSIHTRHVAAAARIITAGLCPVLWPRPEAGDWISPRLAEVEALIAADLARKASEVQPD